jgi:hypothetical protein
MDINEVIERQDREEAERLALLASLPEDVQAAFNLLPDAGRHQVLTYLQQLKDPREAFQRELKAGMFLGAISYAHARHDLDSRAYQCLFAFEQTLTAPPA